MKKEVNAIGDICPIPLVKAKEAIKEVVKRWIVLCGAAGKRK